MPRRTTTRRRQRRRSSAGQPRPSARPAQPRRDLYTAALELEGGSAEDAAAKWLAPAPAACLLRLERPREAEADCREALKQRAPANLLALCAVAHMRQPGGHLWRPSCCVEARTWSRERRRAARARRRAKGARRPLLRPDDKARGAERAAPRGESGAPRAAYDALERPRARGRRRASASRAAGARRSRAASPSRLGGADEARRHHGNVFRDICVGLLSMRRLRQVADGGASG